MCSGTGDRVEDHARCPRTPEPKLYAGTTAIDPPRAVAPCDLAYAELDVTTNFSFLRGASHPDELVYTSALLGYRAMAVTDVNSLAGVVRAHAAAKNVAGFKLIVGARLVFTDGSPDVLAWCPDRAAYARLCRLLTTGKRRAPKGECHLTLDDFLDHSDGLLAAVAAGGRFDERLTRRCLSSLRDAMGRDRLSLAVSMLRGPNDATHLRVYARLSGDYEIPLVATNHVHFHDPGRRRLQDVLTCVRHGCSVREAGYRLFPNGERYLKSPRQMHELFDACPSAVRRSVEIAARCPFTLDELRYEYPDEVVPAGTTVAEHLRDLTEAGAAERYPGGVPDKVRTLIEKELAFICGSKYAPYFLTVYDLVRFARSRSILCQGRGSAANSAVCYCLGITSVDPEHFQLVFERFASAARDEPPDIDVDFEHERREEVIQYVYAKYGRDRAGMTAEVISYRGRSAIRDVGKALGLGLDVVDQLAKRLDWWHRGTLTPAQLEESGVDAGDGTIGLLVTLSEQLLGFPRHLSQHVGGMVVTRGPLGEVVPIENAAMDDRTVIEWDKDDLDAVGMFKVDILALGMLTAISKGLALVNGGAGGTAPPAEPWALHNLPHEDPRVYAMASDADTVGVFQIESRAQMSMLPRLRPERFYDLVIEVAIVRPGPIQGKMVHPYLQARERRRADPDYRVPFPKDELRDVLEQTLGVPLFQEQAMRLAIVAAGFTGEDADRLRRAMAAWKRGGGIEKFYDKFIAGMTGRGYERDFAERCFSQIRGFGEYGFPESHAASFARLVYASAWIKRHHPAAFCCALLNSQPMGFYQPAQLVRDARAHGAEVSPVDVNHSDWDCTLEDGDTPADALARDDDKRTWGVGGPAVRLGFRQVKGLRQDHAARLVAARVDGGPFASVVDLHARAGVPATALRRLAEADAFGSIPLPRRRATWESLRLKDDDAPLFDHLDDRGEELPVLLPTMPVGQEVMTDYATAGLSLKHHPVALVRPALATLKITPADQVRTLAHGRWVKVAGVVLIRQRPGTAAGVVFVTLEDETGVVNLILWPQTYERYRPAARYATLLQADGYVQNANGVVHVLVKRLFDLSGLLAGLDQRSRDFH